MYTRGIRVALYRLEELIFPLAVDLIFGSNFLVFLENALRTFNLANLVVTRCC